MAPSSHPGFPLVSVIIPSFNHGKYLPDAIKSIWLQAYAAVEIIVVDDGSTDNTEEILSDIPGIKYIYQNNQGLSAARNTGIKNSKGDYMVFLDADDWLLEGAIKTNLDYLKQNTALAFVSGAHEKVFVDAGIIVDEIQPVSNEHYINLLQGNYIGMHATVMYRRWVFNEFFYDTNLRSCEDYDLYLSITRRHPVVHHTKKLAAYRLHGNNMSGDITMMLTTALLVLGRQKNNLHSLQEKMAFQKGQAIWKDYYCKLLYEKLVANDYNKKGGFATLLNYHPALAVKYLINYKPVIKFIKSKTPSSVKSLIRKLVPNRLSSPALGKINSGDFGRLRPFSTDFGYDRGGSVDRYYIENFLKNEAGSIKGRTLEIGDNEYTLMFGGNKLTQSDILHVDEKNTKATFIGDLSNAPQLPDNTFDCIVLTQTLHLIFDFKGALDTCYRILKPGGTLLLTSPGITPIDHGEWKSIWYWSFTDASLKILLSKSFPASEVEVTTFGNAHVAAAFLYGMGLPEVSQEKLDYHDPHFQVIITVKAVKSVSA